MDYFEACNGPQRTHTLQGMLDKLITQDSVTMSNSFGTWTGIIKQIGRDSKNRIIVRMHVPTTKTRVMRQYFEYFEFDK